MNAKNTCQNCATVEHRPSNGQSHGGSDDERVVAIDRLADRAKILGQRLSEIRILTGDDQVEALLDCSSMADDFARDLDVLAGAPA